MPQDFSGQNLRGRSFKGQNLEGANFSGADIRSTDFTGANLTGANFSHAQAGLQKHWAIFLVCISWLLSGVAGFLFSIVGALIYSLVNSLQNHLTGWITLIVLIALVIILTFILRRGLNIPVTITGVSFFTIAVFVAFISSFAFIISSYVKGFSHGVVFSLLVTFSVIFVTAVAVAIAGFITVGGVITGSIAGVITVIVAGAGTIAFTTFIIFAFACASSLALLFTFFLGINGLIRTDINGLISTDTTTSLIADVAIGIGFTGAFFIGAFALALISNYIARQAIRGDEKYTLVRNIAITFAAFGGTSFRNANLTDSNFTSATLKSTTFRKANLIRTCFHETKKLDRVRPGTTYLQKAKVVSVLVTGQGQDLNFDRDDLRGVNFTGANLVDASFIGADLSYANLQDADLSRAKLVQTQLDRTNFTGATLTGAYIEDWGITTDTKFDGVRCEYVYMRLPTKENPDPLRKPDNHKEVFADGEFGDFIQPIFDTLDLYHNQGVDPRAIAISLKQLAENHPEAELEIVAMEKRGQDKFLLRAKTAATADKSELSQEYFDTYNQLKALAEQEVKALIAEKDSRISDLQKMITTALQRPSFYSSTQIREVGTMTSNPGGFSIGGSVGGNVNNIQGDNNRAVQGDNNQAVLGDNNQVTQQNQVGADATESLTKEDVVKLLAELEILIKGAELPADTKEEVVEDLSAAKKATEKEEPNKQRALDRLTSVAETLEKTTKTVDSGKKLWTTAKPIIVKVATWLGAAAGSSLLGL
ncbi:MAG: pentapeptide repeat-containing protein [Nostoc sp. TH1S01]|nr:pentapeptide repeat-containing protein [Nostoc sp. TH1S01]